MVNNNAMNEVRLNYGYLYSVIKDRVLEILTDAGIEVESNDEIAQIVEIALQEELNSEEF